MPITLFDKLLARLRGDKLAVLGERGVGKTHLQTFLRTGLIPEVYEQTLVQTTLPAARPQLWFVEGTSRTPKELRVALKPGFDVPGSAEAVEAWKEAIAEATIILYLFRADLILGSNQAHLHRLRDDSKLISEVIGSQSRKRDPKIALVATHYDLVAGYVPPSRGAAFYTWHIQMEHHPDVFAARMELGKVVAKTPALVVGSMSTEAETQDLAYRLFAQELRV